MQNGAEEFTEPLSYGGHWPWLALLAVALVVGFYVGVWVWSRPRKTKQPSATPGESLPDLRTRHLTELDRIETAVRSGEISEREGYQQMSASVRGFVSGYSGIPAKTMTLTDLREAGIPRLPETVELMYPPEFAPDPALGPSDHPSADQQMAREEHLVATLSRARELVSSWN